MDGANASCEAVEATAATLELADFYVFSKEPDQFAIIATYLGRAEVAGEIAYRSWREEEALSQTMLN